MKYGSSRGSSLWFKYNIIGLRNSIHEKCFFFLSDYEEVVKFYILFETVANRASKVVKKAGKTYWKPSVAESQESFILHVKVTIEGVKANGFKCKKMEK